MKASASCFVGDITKPASPRPLYLDTDVESENAVFFPQHVLQHLMENTGDLPLSCRFRKYLDVL